jgi:hypothetical protein
MTHIRKLALALFLALLCSSYSNSQSLDPVTGLELNSTGNVLNLGSGLPWSGTVTGSAGGFSGGPGPAYNPSTGNIIFSYGLNTASQMVAINTALANAGTGIHLSGYKYSWQIHNDLYNYASSRGTLTGNVSLIGSTGIVLESFNYDYNQNLPSFTTFSGTQFFNNRYDPSSTSGINVSFTGKDQNWWAGYYGPRVHVDNLSLLYTLKPDPCIADPLSSPICPGYALATVKNSILGSTVSNASATSFVPTINYALSSPGPAAGPALTGTDFTNPVPQQQGPVAGPQGSVGPQGPMGQQGPAAGPQGQDPNQNSGGPQDSPSQPGPQGPQQGPAAGPQPAGGPPQQAQSAPQSSSGPSQAGPAAGPSRSNDGPKMTPGAASSVARAAQEKDKAVQATAVQNAVKAFEGAVQSSNAASNAAITMNQDMSASSATAAAQFASQTTQSSMQMSGQTQQINNAGQTYNGTGLSVAKANISVFNADSLNNFSTGQVSGQMSSVTQFRNESKTYEVEESSMQVAGFGGKAGNPLSDIMNQRMDMMQTNVEQRADSVKKNVQPNDLAGGVDVAAMAQIPKGYEAYSLVVLRDAPFYKPEAIYKNQTTVDNVRVFRGLAGGSDAKHQQMVDSQYK